jgi:hypothetical protein
MTYLYYNFNKIAKIPQELNETIGEIVYKIHRI